MEDNKESNDWKKSFQQDMENVFNKERKKGVSGWIPQKARSISIGNLRPPLAASRGPPPPSTPQTPSVFHRGIRLSLNDVPPSPGPLTGISIRKSLSESRITTPRLAPLTPMTGRSMSISSIAIPPSPSPSVIPSIPILGGLSQTSTIEEHPETPKIIAAPAPKVSISEHHDDTEDQERPLSQTKLKQIQSAADGIKSMIEESQLQGLTVMHQHLTENNHPPIEAYLKEGVSVPLLNLILHSK